MLDRSLLGSTSCLQVSVLDQALSLLEALARPCGGSWRWNVFPEVLPGLTVWQLLLRDWEGKDVNQIGPLAVSVPFVLRREHWSQSESVGNRANRRTFLRGLSFVESEAASLPSPRTRRGHTFRD